MTALYITGGVVVVAGFLIWLAFRFVRRDAATAASEKARADTAEDDSMWVAEAAEAQGDIDQVIIDRRADLRERLKRGDV